MQDHSFLSSFDDDDVIEFGPDTIMKIIKLREALIKVVRDDMENNFNGFLSNRGFRIPSSIRLENQEGNGYDYYNTWLKGGVYCEVLKPGAKNWQKGKIKVIVSVEFEPDEPEIAEPSSPLDDIRKEINQ